MPYALGPTATSLLNRPYGGVSPFAPAGIPDATRQGWATQLQGLGSGMGGAQDYARAMADQGRWTTANYKNRQETGQFSGNPAMRYATGMASSAPNQPGFGQAAGTIGNTLMNYGGGWSPGMANTINQTGASFSPWNPMLGQMAGEANAQLGRDFRQNTMPGLNRSLVGAGPGAYGGTRAGIAQGLREQGLADAMQRQTTDIFGKGYESGLGRYVQDRGQTLAATGNALQRGGALGLQGAQLQGNLANMQGGLQNQAAGIIGNLGTSGLSQGNQMFRFGHGQLLPQSIQNQYRASQAPGQLMQQYGGMLSGFGGAQQGQNQRVQDWYNQQYNHAQGYPNQQMNSYTGWTSPISNPGVQQPMPQNTSAYSNPWGGAAYGAAAGAGMYNTWKQNNANAPAAQAPVSGDANYPYQQYPNAGGGWGMPAGGYSGTGQGAFGSFS